MRGMLLDIGYAAGVTRVLGVPKKPVRNGTRAG
jgi:hypothetical protein